MGDNLKTELDEAFCLLQSITTHYDRLSDLVLLPFNAREASLATASAAAVNQVLRGALAVLATENNRWGL